MHQLQNFKKDAISFQLKCASRAARSRSGKKNNKKVEFAEAVNKSPFSPSSLFNHLQIHFSPNVNLYVIGISLFRTLLSSLSKNDYHRAWFHKQGIILILAFYKYEILPIVFSIGPMVITFYLEVVLFLSLILFLRISQSSKKLPCPLEQVHRLEAGNFAKD